jgi:hypothetical protein
MRLVKSLLGNGKTEQPESAASPQAAAIQLDLLIEQMQAAESEYDFANLAIQPRP